MTTHTLGPVAEAPAGAATAGRVCSVSADLLELLNATNERATDESCHVHA